ncbi:MAG: ABC transporter permease [Candidatus Methanofastidiosia archaeon]
MSKFYEVARREYLENIKRKGFLFTTFVLPLFMVSVMAIPSLVIALSSHAGESIGIVDESGDFYKDLLQSSKDKKESEFSYSQDYTLLSIESLEVAEGMLERDEIVGYLVIPEDFLETSRAYYYSKSSNILTSERLSSSLRQTKAKKLLEDVEISEEKIEKIIERVEIRNFKVLKGEVKEESELSFMKPFLFAYFLVVSIFASSGYLLQGVVEEKENRVIEILLSSISANQLMVGKILGLGAVGLTQLFIWSSGLVLLSRNLPISLIPLSSLPFVFIYFLLGFLLFACILSAIGAISTSLRESQQISGAISLIAILPIFVFFAVMDKPNSLLVRVFSHFPIFTPTLMMMRIAITEVSLIDILTTILVLSLSVLGFGWLAIKIFRVGLLMYGKRPTFSEILKWIRYQ